MADTLSSDSTCIHCGGLLALHAAEGQCVDRPSNPHAKWLRAAAEAMYKQVEYSWSNTCEEAADEIERLTKGRVERDIYDAVNRRNAEMYAENERLRSELALAEANANTATNTVLAVNVVLRADIARLNERNAANEREIERLTKMLEASRRSNALLQLDPLAKEIERLRAALETVRGHKHCGPCDRTCTEWLSDIAREALRPADETDAGT